MSAAWWHVSCPTMRPLVTNAEYFRGRGVATPKSTALPLGHARRKPHAACRNDETCTRSVYPATLARARMGHTGIEQERTRLASSAEHLLQPIPAILIPFAC